MRERSGCPGVLRRGIISVVLFALFTAQGCLTYSSFQSARIVERGHPHSIVGISRSVHLNEDNSGLSWWTVDGEMQFGIVRRVDGSVRVSVFHNVPEGGGGSQFSVDCAGVLSKTTSLSHSPSASL